jgi:hypothetical protein
MRVSDQSERGQNREKKSFHIGMMETSGNYSSGTTCRLRLTYWCFAFHGVSALELCRQFPAPGNNGG